MDWLWFLLGIAPLTVGAWFAANRLVALGPGHPRILAAFLLGWAWIAIGMLLLGNLGLINRPAVVAWSFLACLPTIRAWFDRRAEAPLAAETDPGRFGLAVAFALGLTLWAAIYLLGQCLIYPVKVVSDGPIYHLYFAARWWREGRLFAVATPFGETAAAYFPHVGELVMTWAFTLWGGDAPARAAQAPFLLAAMFAAYASAREIGIGRSASALASLVFGSITPLIVFTFEPNVDTIFTAGYLIAAYFFMRVFRGKDEPASILLGALAAGGAWGTKPTGIIFVPPVILVVAVGLLLRPGTRTTRRNSLILLAVGLFILEGYWLLRNLIWTGNPLYPLHLAVGGTTILHGWYGPDAMPKSHYYMPFRNFGGLVDILQLVLDPRLVPLWAGATLAAFLPGMPAERRRCTRLFTLGMLANVALFWCLIPYRTQQRFLFQGLGLGVVPLAALLDRLGLFRVAAAGLLAIHYTTPQVWPLGRPWLDLDPVVPSNSPPPTPLPPGSLVNRAYRTDLLWIAATWLIALGGFVVAGLITLGSDRRRRLFRVVAAVLLGVLCLAQSKVIRPDRAAEATVLRYPPFSDYYNAWFRLEALTGKARARIAYAGTNLPFYLMGPEFKNDVLYVNVDEHADWLLHDYHRAAAKLGGPDPWPDTRPLWDRLAPNYDAWLKNLRTAAIDFLVVARANPAEGAMVIAEPEGFPIERVWADRHPEVFTPVHGQDGDPRIRIWRVRPSER